MGSDYLIPSCYFQYTIPRPPDKGLLFPGPPDRPYAMGQGVKTTADLMTVPHKFLNKKRTLQEVTILIPRLRRSKIY